MGGMSFRIPRKQTTELKAGMGWFTDVPDAINVGSETFLVAGAAIEEWESRLAKPRVDGERSSWGPELDWPASALFLLARVQLTQAVSILRSGFAIDARLWSGIEVSRRLRHEVLNVRGGGQAVEDFGREIGAIGEGVDLWRALDDVSLRDVTYHLDSDGDVAIITGPELPDLEILGFESNAELNVSPARIFAAAKACTGYCAELAVRYGMWREDGYVRGPESTDP
jgi:hypothetical protein